MELKTPSPSWKNPSLISILIIGTPPLINPQAVLWSVISAMEEMILTRKKEETFKRVPVGHATQMQSSGRITPTQGIVPWSPRTQNGSKPQTMSLGAAHVMTDRTLVSIWHISPKLQYHIIPNHKIPNAQTFSLKTHCLGSFVFLAMFLGHDSLRTPI